MLNQLRGLALYITQRTLPGLSFLKTNQFTISTTNRLDLEKVWYFGFLWKLTIDGSTKWRKIFPFSKDRIQASVLEVTVKDKDVIKDNFIGYVLFDLNEVPKRVPPDSPLAPQWYKLEDRKSDKSRGELMLAVWRGTQAREAFSEAWHSDAATINDTDALANIRCLRLRFKRIRIRMVDL